jgi:S-adenosylmethionine:tRNA ribosyltransferase-isomerase
VLNDTRASDGRVIAVGTTATRVLETQYRDGKYTPGEGQTGHYIYPPYEFRAVDCLQTNFHLPCSSLLALVYAFAGADLVREAYQFAIGEKFRFYSYGDVMLIV